MRNSTAPREAFLAEAQRLSGTGSFCWRVGTDEIIGSEQLYRIFDFDHGVPVTLELMGSRVQPPDVPLLNEMIERARGAGGDFEYEHQLLMRDHSMKYVRLVAHATRDQEGRLEYIGAVQDLTQHRLSEEALGKARSELAHVARVTSLGALTASIAHEVNQPIAAALTNGQAALRWLGKQPPDLVEVQQALERIVRDGTRAGEIIDRMRALFGKAPPSKADLDINEVVGEIVALTQGEALKNRVTVRAELEGGLPVVRADRVQLQQVVLNLIANAIEAMSEIEDKARDLHITTAQHTPDGVIVTVRDTGPGLTLKSAEDVFEALYTTKPTGLGMGLPICRTIIEAHGGKMWASANKPRGAIFQFTLPQMEEE